MAFDEEFARRFAYDEDRDEASFFAGRERELEGFGRTLAAAETRRRPAFRVYQGAPGAGKTALLERMIETRGNDETLFVLLSNRHLSDMDLLAERIARTAAERASNVGKVADAALQGLGGFLRAGAAADRIGGFLAQRNVRRVALCLDEAQTVDESCAPGLRELHVVGIGRPAVVVLVGLSHTADRVRALGGLSRLSSEAVTNLGMLFDEDCAESTGRLLIRADPKGDRERAAHFVAGLSLGWPQHLKVAQKALCRELLRVRGSLDRMDFARIRRETDAERIAYYEGRLAKSLLGLRPALTAAMVGDVRRRAGGIDELELDAVCEARLAALRPDHPRLAKVSGEDFARALVEKGVLSHAAGGGFEVSIPSMADWLEGVDARGRPPPTLPRTPGLGR